MTEITPRIAVDETVRFGKPVIAGTRVPVALVVAKLAGGMTIEQVMTEPIAGIWSMRKASFRIASSSDRPLEVGEIVS